MLPSNTKLVARPTRFGNPYKSGENGIAAGACKDTDPARPWLTNIEKAVEAQDSTTLKLAYFQGVLDWAAMMDTESETVTGFEEPTATR